MAQIHMADKGRIKNYCLIIGLFLVMGSIKAQIVNRTYGACKYGESFYGTNDCEVKSKVCALYPNPNTGIFSLDNVEFNEKIIVSDDLGKIVFSSFYYEEKLKLNNLAKGIYFVKTEKCLFKLAKHN
jgi:Secretion system C-terminal sorting domain